MSQSEAYWIVFVVAFLAVALWESTAPVRPSALAAERRWSVHGVLLAIGALLKTLVLRASPVLVASKAAANPTGLMNHTLMPAPVRWIVALLVLDLARYATHRLFHSFYWLWRVHEVHHSDPDYDVSTGARFHPLEILISQTIYLGVVLVLAPPAAAVLCSELLSVAINFFAHANALLPEPLERAVAKVFVTPAFHRLHHSLEAADQQTNFSQTFPWWDWIFGTSGRRLDKRELETGVKEVPQDAALRLGWLVAAPFLRRPRLNQSVRAPLGAKSSN